MTSKFEVGTKVAVIRSVGRFGDDRKITSAVVGKVHKNGNFTIGEGNQQYKPNYTGDSAMETGASRYHGPTIEVWGTRHEEELEAKKAQVIKNNVANEMMTLMNDRQNRYTANFNISEETVAACRAVIEQIKKDTAI